MICIITVQIQIKKRVEIFQFHHDSLVFFIVITVLFKFIIAFFNAELCPTFIIIIFCITFIFSR